MVSVRKERKRYKLFRKLRQWNKTYKKNEKVVREDIKANKSLLNAYTHVEFLEHAPHLLPLLW